MTLDGAFASLGALTTERLELRQMHMADAEALYAVKSDPRVTSCYGQEPHRSIEDTKAWIQRSVINFERRDSVFWTIVVKDERRVIGACCFWNFDPTFHCAEIGYELHPDYWNRGIMTEALSAMLTYGFCDMGLHRIEAVPLARNERSWRLLEGLGFRREGVLRHRVYYRGHHEDQLYLGLLKQEWLGRRGTI